MLEARGKSSRLGWMCHRKVVCAGLRTTLKERDVPMVTCNSYYGGSVRSLALTVPRGRLTVGVFEPGTFEFTASDYEEVTVLEGQLLFATEQLTKELYPGRAYVIPPGTTFRMTASAPTTYLCFYFRSSEPLDASYGEVEWVQYRWNLADLADPPPDMANVSVARLRTPDPKEVERVVIEAYASDPVWAPMLPDIEARMAGRLHQLWQRDDVAYVVATSAGEMVAASVVAARHASDQHLLTGICVLPSAQHRGVGQRVLWASLDALRGLGVSDARVYTEAGSIADRHLYANFGARRLPGVFYPGLIAAAGEA